MADARIARLLALGALASFAVGCDCGGGLTTRGRDSGGVDSAFDAGPTIVGLTALRLEPLDATIEIIDGVPATLEYHAFGTFEGGVEREVTDEVTFNLASPSPLGAFHASTFTSYSVSGGVGEVSVRANGLFEATSLTIRMRSTIAIPPTGGAPALPSNPASLFGGTADASRAPNLVYPNDAVVLPPNLGRIEIHWLTGSSANTLFELGFHNDITDIRFYVRCERPTGVDRADGCIFEPSGAFWSALAETNRGGDPLMLTVRGTDDTGTSVGTSSTRTMRFARDSITGTIYYWAISDTSIVRYDFGAAADAAEPVLTPMQAEGRCVGCHALSRDGRRILGTVGGIGSGGMLLYDLETYAPLRAAPNEHILQFGSFNPDGTELVGCYGDDGAPQDRGLIFFDTRCDPAIPGSMATCGQITTTHSIGGREVSHPAWSFDGNHIAYTDVDGDGVSQRPRHGAIGVVDREGGDWSAPRFLVDRADGISRLNPDWAPEDRFVAFTESVCPGGNLDDRDCNGDSDPSSTIYGVPAAGGSPVRFTNAMREGTMDEGRTELNNTFARFAPFEFVLSSDEFGTSSVVWISFASTRAYGIRTALGGNVESGGRGLYLWMAAVSPEAVMRGEDPSYAAFALPFQDLTTSNHIAVWTTESVGNPVVM
jgi:hypothetical protein